MRVTEKSLQIVHRRLAAAKLAASRKSPAIADMKIQEQFYMLLENISDDLQYMNTWHSDMLDLGRPSQTFQKNRFSETTVGAG
jgi:hypothetical protein